MEIAPDPAAAIDDHAALRDLSVRYAAAVDARDGAAFAALFEADGELLVPKYPDDLRPVIARSGTAALSRVPEALRRYTLTFHQVSNHRFRVDGDDAAGAVQCVAHHLSGIPPDVSDTVWFIRYADTYRRRDSSWRFQKRVLHLQWVEHHHVQRIGASGVADGPEC